MDRPDHEKDLELRHGWKHTYEPHSCRHCDWIVIKESELKAGEDLQGHQLSSLSNVYLADSISDAVLARDEGCALFEYLLDEINSKGLSFDILDLDGSRAVYGSFTDGRLKLSHNLDEYDSKSPMRFLNVAVPSGTPTEPLECDPGSPNAFQVARKWISTCLSSHPHCRLPPLPPGTKPFAPTRLLQVGEHGVKLVESSDEGDEAQTWCALSYVWGGDQPVKTTRENLSAHYDNIPFDKLPRTIRDAVRVCRGLDIRYLWVDALCIIQGDEQDLRKELGTMSEIYMHATVTISAAWSTKADDGFLHPRGHWYHYCPPIKLKVNVQTRQRSGTEKREEKSMETTETYAHEHAYVDREWRDDPINSRAWTYQEHILSQRMLLYRSTLLEWGCWTVFDSYGLIDPAIKSTRPYPQLSSKLDPNCSSVLSSSIPWSNIISEYSTRHLSVASDRLPGLSAIARIYHRETGKEYLAGLWREDLPLALCWWADGSTSRGMTQDDYFDAESSFQIPSKGLSDYRALSWSWVSINDAVYALSAANEEEFSPNYRPAPEVKVFRAEVTPAYEGGEFDSVASGYIDIQGPMKEVTASLAAQLLQEKASSPGSVSGLCELNVSVGEQGHEVTVVLDAAPQNEELESMRNGTNMPRMWLLMLAEQAEEDEDEEDEEESSYQLNNETAKGPAYQGLVLREVVQGRSDILRRMGYFACCGDSCDGSSCDDGCSDLRKEFRIRRVTIV
ncbi:heterokaryon incompatibility protein-domain-containing protein [Sordaria brevicollis]|uniref:Heterokaryon incompatibility protein-domain-containing protein n=1 Tax=Sordaria brevicollis TaxID=83679 RepID=A0AAE0U2X8_SORBR|nr:heterokaryon incompatibility protein-domain-containing protein [Sordaria brevicollis]